MVRSWGLAFTLLSFVFAFLLVDVVVNLLPVSVMKLAGRLPSDISEGWNTSALSEAERETQIAAATEQETTLMITGAGLLLGLLLTNFFFGPHKSKGKLGNVCVIIAAVAAVYSLWMGFRVINELKWLIQFGISFKLWGLSRIDYFHLAQIVSLMIAVPFLGVYVLDVLRQKFEE